jgi:ABC-type bacteriocin/lantibiotic exporter with double-glycine peptidase domain
MTTALIELADVRLTLGQGEVRTEILKGISLRLDPGESLAILGPSGSGKSSLMAVVAGLERATSGSVRLLGEDASTLGEDALARMRGRDIGIVLQSFQLLPTMTAIRLDLPDPEGPRIARLSPGSSLSDIPFNISVRTSPWPRVRRTSASSIKAVVMCGS